MIKRKFKTQQIIYGCAAGFIFSLLLAALVLRAAPAYAQGSQELLTAITQQMGRSMQALTSYSYQQRTEVQVDGETKSVQVVQVAFGPDKQPLITTISSQPSGDTGFGLRARIKERKAEEMKEEVENLVQLSNSYLMLSQEKMQQLVRQGQVLVNPDSGNVRVNVSSLLQTGDQITMDCQGTTKNRIQTQVQTTSDGTSVKITAQYLRLSTGLNYAAQTVINVPDKGLQIMINTMNYQQLAAAPPTKVVEPPQDPGWPRQRIENGNKLVIYQPQVDDWKNFTELDWRMAVELTPKGGKPAVGVIVMKANTLVDNDSKMVMMTDIKIIQTHFPSLDPALAMQMEQLARTFLPETVSISLHRIVASVPKKESVPGVPLKNDPPAIFVSYTPAILLRTASQSVHLSRRPVWSTWSIRTGGCFSTNKAPCFISLPVSSGCRPQT
jgi:hypothetical protein